MTWQDWNPTGRLPLKPLTLVFAPTQAKMQAVTKNTVFHGDEATSPLVLSSTRCSLANPDFTPLDTQPADPVLAPRPLDT